MAAALERALTGDPRLRTLPAKFGILIDDGGPLSIAGERADICLAASGEEVAGPAVEVGVDTFIELGQLLEAVMRRVRGFVPQ